MEVGEELLILVTYDVMTSSDGGTKRLRKVARICQSYGQRVQNSNFECIVDATQFAEMKIKLRDVIDEDVDSIRFYRLGNQHKTKVEHIGAKEVLDLEGPLIF